MNFQSCWKTAWLKDKINFKIYDITIWLTNNCNSHIDQYIKKYRQLDNEIWSVNWIQHEKHFSSKIMHKMQWRYYSQPLYTACFLFLCKVEGYQNILKENCSQLLLPHIKLFLKNKKRSGTSLPDSFSAWFSKKNSFLVTFSYLIKFHCLFAFTLWDIGQYVHCSCLLTRLWHYKFWH